MVLQQLVRQPRRDREGNHQRHDHGDGNVGRHGAQILAHHVGDEEQREEGKDHGERRRDQRRSDFIHGFQNDLGRGFASHLEVAVDVLHVHDGIVHQQAEGDRQREQRDAIDGESEEIVDDESETEDTGNRDGHHQRLPVAQPHGQQRHDHRDGDQQALFEFFDLVVGGDSIVPRHYHLHVGGQNFLLQLFHPLQEVLGYPDVVRAVFLGYGDGDGGLRAVLGRG